MAETTEQFKARMAREKAETAALVSADDVNRMRVTWKKARAMYASFFAQLATVQKQIGDEKLFTRWMVDHLNIGPSRVTKVAGILVEDDAKRVQEELRRAKVMEQAQRRAEREAETMTKHEAKPTREPKAKPLTEAEAVAFLRARGYATIEREPVVPTRKPTTTCLNCGKPLAADKIALGGSYCDGACRVAAYRKRQRAST